MSTNKPKKYMERLARIKVTNDKLPEIHVTYRFCKVGNFISVESIVSQSLMVNHNNFIRYNTPLKCIKLLTPSCLFLLNSFTRHLFTKHSAKNYKGERHATELGSN